MSELALARSVEDITDELYGVPPRSFVAARERRAAEARAGGDAATATLVLALRRPTAAAWMSNQLVRWWRDEVLDFVDLGRALRYATQNLAGDELWLLTDRRKWAQRSLFHQIDQLAIEDRVALNASSRRGLADTLQAAVCSADMAARMLTGRLTRPLDKISWPGLSPLIDHDELARRRVMRLVERARQPTPRGGDSCDADAYDADTYDAGGNGRADGEAGGGGGVRLATVMVLPLRRVR